MSSRHRVALATSAKLADLHEDDLRLAPALSKTRIEWDPAVWTDPAVNWGGYDAVVIRSVWDYFERFAEFTAWLGKLGEAGVRVLNPVEAMLVNSDKAYLRDFEQAGVKVLPTRWIEKGATKAEVSAVLGNLPWDEVVIKPSVSAGAFRTARLAKGSLAAMQTLAETIVQDSHALIQPFMAEVLTAGEWSFLFFGDEFSHAVVKQPKAGDFRVQFTHGGRHRKAEPAPEVLRQAVQVLRASRRAKGCGGDRLYTRVDGIVRGNDFLCIEVELIEPYLFFEEDDEAPQRFVDALDALL